MRNVVLYICQSIDGYIADEKEAMDWMVGNDEAINKDSSYPTFIKQVDTILMGWNTYETIQKLSDVWPYEAHTYVFTHHPMKQLDSITFVNEDLEPFVNRLRLKDGKDIWICGGSQLIHECMKAQLITDYRIFTIPVLLGAGIPLFQGCKQKLYLYESHVENGIVENRYRNK